MIFGHTLSWPSKGRWGVAFQKQWPQGVRSYCIPGSTLLTTNPNFTGHLNLIISSISYRFFSHKQPSLAKPPFFHFSVSLVVVVNSRSYCVKPSCAPLDITGAISARKRDLLETRSIREKQPLNVNARTTNYVSKRHFYLSTGKYSSDSADHPPRTVVDDVIRKSAIVDIW